VSFASRPIDARQRLPEHGERVIVWCSRTRKWRSGSWFDADGWSVGGYTRQDVRWWYPAPPEPPQEDA
jgi:hypothetical protein